MFYGFAWLATIAVITIFLDKILNLNWIEKYVNKSTLDVRYVNKLLGILALEIWYRLFITQDLDSNEKLVV